MLTYLFQNLVYHKNELLACSSYDLWTYYTNLLGHQPNYTSFYAKYFMDVYHHKSVLSPSHLQRAIKSTLKCEVVDMHSFQKNLCFFTSLDQRTQQRSFPLYDQFTTETV